MPIEPFYLNGSTDKSGEMSADRNLGEAMKWFGAVCHKSSFILTFLANLHSNRFLLKNNNYTSY